MRTRVWSTPSIVALALCGCSIPAATNTGAGTTARSAGTTARSAGTTARSEGLALITEPGPGDGPFIALIDGARRSVQVTIYELSDRRVEQALAAAAARGVYVAVLLDHGRYGSGRALNDTAHRYLATHGVRVAWAPAYFALTHQKSIVIDKRVAAIMTLNLTPTYYSSSRDFAVLDYRAADIEEIAQTFEADVRHRQITPGGGSGDLVWSPGAQAPLDALIAHARHSVQVESEELEDPAITGTLCRAARRGVRVQVLMTYQPAARGSLTYLDGCGAQVRTYAPGAALYIHAKLILIDGDTAFIGSQNLSRQSLIYNRELGIITHDSLVIASAGRTFDGDFEAGRGSPVDARRSNQGRCSVGR